MSAAKSTARRVKRKEAPPKGPEPERKRYPAAVREAQLIKGAAAFFANHGFAATTRDLADELEVTQALLYRYFKNKAALIDRVLDWAMTDRWRPEWQSLIADESRPLAERLVQFYQEYAGDITQERMRLMVRAGIDGFGMPQRKSFRLTEHVLMPVCRAIRHEAGLPDFTAVPFTRGERELSMSLHGGIIFVCIRKHVYRMDLPDDLDVLVEMQVRNFVSGAPETLAAILRGDLGATLTVPLMGPDRRRA
jgi:AcrR family transcriptional regulator